MHDHGTMVMDEITLAAAFLVGLFGSTHCAGMCGGVISALTLGLPDNIRGRFMRMLPFVLLYNIGRIASYALAGLLVAGIGSLIVDMLDIKAVRFYVALVAGGFMVILGLYIAGWWQGLMKLENLGGHVWKYFEPLGRKFLPIKNYHGALIAGAIWGWIPCGMVYTALVWTLTASSSIQGALLMVSFGLGTLPAMLFMGLMAGKLVGSLQKPLVRNIAGLTVIVFGVYSLWRVL